MAQDFRRVSSQWFRGVTNKRSSFSLFMKNLIVTALILLLAVSSAAAQSNQPIHVGVLLCQTGTCAETGTSALHGLQLASEELNRTNGIGGRPLRLDVQDTAESDNARGAVDAFHALTNNPDIKVLIGPSWDVGGMPLVPLMKKRNDLILISPSVGVAEFSSGSENIFNLWPLDELAMEELANTVLSKGWRTAGILSSNNNWAQTQAHAFQKELERQGGKVQAIEEPLSTQTDLRSELLRIASKKPDVVLFTMFSHLPIAAKELRQLGYKGRYLSVQMDQERINVTGPAIEGTIFPKFSPANDKFIEAYRGRFSAEPQMSADTAYDALFLLKQAADICGGVEIACIKRAISSRTFEGVTGPIMFSSRRTVSKTPRLFDVRDGKMVELKR